MTLLTPLLLALAALAAAQNSALLDFTSPNALPQCAQACTPLYSAQGACVPPAVPAGDAKSQRACFCNSPVLASLNTATAGLCDTACPPSDLARVRSWYLTSCGKQAASSAGQGQATRAAVAATGTATPGSVGSGSSLSPLETGGHWCADSHPTRMLPTDAPAGGRRTGSGC